MNGEVGGSDKEVVAIKGMGCESCAWQVCGVYLVL